MSEITSVTAATRSTLPAPCISCVFWQHDRLVSDERHKAAWSETFERRHGAFGRVLRDGPAFRGMVQFGPAEAFPRALALPAPRLRTHFITPALVALVAGEAHFGTHC